MRTFVAIAFLSALLAGCASTRMTSFKDPDFYVTSYRRFMVVVDHPNLQTKIDLEQLLAESFLDEGVPATEHYKIFPPTREFTPEQEMEILKERGIDGIVVVVPGNAGYTSTYVPPTVSVTTKTEKTSSGEKTRTNVSTSGGYDIQKPWAEASAKVYDVASGRCAWMSSAFTSGNGFASMNVVNSSFADELVDQLLDQRLVAPSGR